MPYAQANDVQKVLKPATVTTGYDDPTIEGFITDAESMVIAELADYYALSNLLAWRDYDFVANTPPEILTRLTSYLTAGLILESAATLVQHEDTVLMNYLIKRAGNIVEKLINGRMVLIDEDNTKHVSDNTEPIVEYAERGIFAKPDKDGKGGWIY